MRTSILCSQRILAVILLIYIVPFGACSSQAVEKRKINVVFRCDDYSACSRTDIELKILDAFRKSKATITFGVIPFVASGDVHDPSPEKLLSLTPAKCDILRPALKDGILDIALNGYSHQTINAKQMTEFSGLEYNN